MDDLYWPPITATFDLAEAALRVTRVVCAKWMEDGARKMFPNAVIEYGSEDTVRILEERW